MSGRARVGKLPGIYNASLQELGRAEVLSRGRILCVEGSLIDAVEKLLPRPLTLGSDDGGHQAVLKAFPASYADTDKQTRNRFRMERIRNLVRTCTADADLRGRKLSEETVTIWLRGAFLMRDAYSDKESDDEEHGGNEENDQNGDSDFLKELERPWKEEDDQDADSDYEAGSEEELYSPGDGSFGDFVEGMSGFHTCYKTKSGSRRFLRTREGRMALGPDGVAAGDVICVVLGCNTPLVLRRKPLWEWGYYQLVGACYVHGAMYGEAVTELSGSEPSTILIV